MSSSCHIHHFIITHSLVSCGHNFYRDGVTTFRFIYLYKNKKKKEKKTEENKQNAEMQEILFPCWRLPCLEQILPFEVCAVDALYDLPDWFNIRSTAGEEASKISIWKVANEVFCQICNKPTSQHKPMNGNTETGLRRSSYEWNEKSTVAPEQVAALNRWQSAPFSWSYRLPWNSRTCRPRLIRGGNTASARRNPAPFTRIGKSRRSLQLTG